MASMYAFVCLLKMINKYLMLTSSAILLFMIVKYDYIYVNNVLGLLDNDEIYLARLKFGHFIENIPFLGSFLGLGTRVTEKLFYVEELTKFNGEVGSEGLYLAIFGKVYDVEKGKKHYGTSGTYHYFAGRDGSKAFITGDFSGSGAADDVLSLQPEELVDIKKWLDFYETEYIYKGKLVGRYYDSYGNPTKYQKQVMKILQEVEEKKKKSEDMELKYPPCNSEWNRESGTKVWCSQLSGGIRRDWIGVPRMLYSPGSDSYRCGCVEDPDDANIKRSSREYPGCHPRSESCRVYT